MKSISAPIAFDEFDWSLMINGGFNRLCSLVLLFTRLLQVLGKKLVAASDL